MNHAFYQEIADSLYEDGNDHPEIQKLREKLGSAFTWFPNKEERASLKKLMLSGKT